MPQLAGEKIWEIGAAMMLSWSLQEVPAKRERGCGVVKIDVAYRCNDGGRVAVRDDMKVCAVQAAQEVEHVHESSVTRREGAEKESALGAFDLYCRSKYEGGIGLLDGLDGV